MSWSEAGVAAEAVSSIDGRNDNWPLTSVVTLTFSVPIFTSSRLSTTVLAAETVLLLCWSVCPLHQNITDYCEVVPPQLVTISVFCHFKFSDTLPYYHLCELGTFDRWFLGKTRSDHLKTCIQRPVGYPNPQIYTQKLSICAEMQTGL